MATFLSSVHGLRSRRFVCRWCGQSFSVWALGGEGRLPVNGGDALVEHVYTEHPVEYEKMRSQLDDEFGEEDPPQ